MAALSSILAWRTPWTEESSGPVHGDMTEHSCTYILLSSIYYRHKIRIQPLEVYNAGKTRIKSQIPSLKNILLYHLVNIFIELSLFLIVCVHMFTLFIYTFI